MTGRRVGKFEWERGLLADPQVRGNQLLTLLALGVSMNADGSGARPGVESLATGTGIGRSTVRRHLSASTAQDRLELTRRGHRLGNGQAHASEYAAVLPISTAHLGERKSTPEGAISTAHADERKGDSLPLTSAVSTAQSGFSTAHLGERLPISSTRTDHHQTRAGDARSRSQPPHADLIEITKDAVREKTGKSIGDEQARRVIALITDGRPIRNAAKYVRAAIKRDEDPARFLPIQTPPRYTPEPRPASHAPASQPVVFSGVSLPHNYEDRCRYLVGTGWRPDEAIKVYWHLATTGGDGPYTDDESFRTTHEELICSFDLDQARLHAWAAELPEFVFEPITPEKGIPA